MNSLPFGQLKSSLKILIGVQYNFFGFLFYFPLYERGKVVYNIPIVYLGGGTFELFEVRP